MKLEAVIFDLDGTVLSNEDEWARAFKKVLKDLGKDVKDEYPQVGGIGVTENWPIFKSRYKFKTSKTFEELATETQEEYLRLLDSVTIKPGFSEFVSSLREAGVMTALATSGIWFTLEKVLEKMSLDKYFDLITTGEEVKYKKPDPDIFIKTAEKLGIERENCLVIEDSQAGIEAAHRAGMKAIGLARDKAHALELLKADRVIVSFHDLSINQIASL